MARERVTGDKRNWWSLRPKEYRELIDLPYWDQIIAQIYYAQREIEKGLSSINRNQWLEIRYSDLCKNPRKQIMGIFKTVEREGAEVDWIPDDIPEQFQSRDVQRISAEEYLKLLVAAGKYFDVKDPTNPS